MVKTGDLPFLDLPLVCKNLCQKIKNHPQKPYQKVEFLHIWKIQVGTIRKKSRKKQGIQKYIISFWRISAPSTKWAFSFFKAGRDFLTMPTEQVPDTLGSKKHAHVKLDHEPSKNQGKTLVKIENL